MQNFTFYNPTRIIFGKGAIASLAEVLPTEARILMTYGGGSIKVNGVYDQVRSALHGRDLIEFGGIEPNPTYETLMKAVDVCTRQDIDFLLSVGGGSTLDGTKFIAAAARFDAGDPWDILCKGAEVKSALPIGCVLTLPATGSESNRNAVVSRVSTQQKRAFGSPMVLPAFAILDPETTYSLPQRQTSNGIVDAFVHVCEQYLTFPSAAPLQDRQAEAVLLTLVEEGPKVLANPKDYEARANVMWCATQALNGILACGVPQDWSTHLIGHEITALYGLDHAQTLAVVLPATLQHRRVQKADKLLQYGERVWGITEGGREARIDAAIAQTEEFFRSVGMRTRLHEYNVTEGIHRIGERLEQRGAILGELHDIGRTDVDAIIELCK